MKKGPVFEPFFNFNKDMFLHIAFANAKYRQQNINTAKCYEAVNDSIELWHSNQARKIGYDIGI